jgi:hypothetical protein
MGAPTYLKIVLSREVGKFSLRSLIRGKLVVIFIVYNGCYVGEGSMPRHFSLDLRQMLVSSLYIMYVSCPT